jgi:predicted NodU family carbamoyl transferase
MNILGINISHNVSIAFYIDKKITNFYEEDRFNFQKNFEIKSLDDTFLISLDEKLNFKPDIVCYASYPRNETVRKFHWSDPKVINTNIIEKIQKQLNNIPYFFNELDHHIYHLTNVFYFSSFEEAMGIIIDGGGATHKQHFGYEEKESIYYINKKEIIKKYQHYSNREFCLIDKSIFDASQHTMRRFENGVEIDYSSKAVGGHLFMLVSNILELGHEPGKTMGLSSYSKTNKEYGLNKKHIELAQYAQDETFKRTCQLIEKAYDYKKIKNFVLSGGYFLNCSNNFKYVKRYPELNFFVDPIPTDAGMASGVCIYYDNYR